MASCTPGRAKHDGRDSHERPCRAASLTGTGRGDHAKHGGWGCGPLRSRLRKCWLPGVILRRIWAPDHLAVVRNPRRRVWFHGIAGLVADDLQLRTRRDLGARGDVVKGSEEVARLADAAHLANEGVLAVAG